MYRNPGRLFKSSVLWCSVSHSLLHRSVLRTRAVTVSVSRRARMSSALLAMGGQEQSARVSRRARLQFPQVPPTPVWLPTVFPPAASLPPPPEIHHRCNSLLKHRYSLSLSLSISLPLSLHSRSLPRPAPLHHNIITCYFPQPYQHTPLSAKPIA